MACIELDIACHLQLGDCRVVELFLKRKGRNDSVGKDDVAVFDGSYEISKEL